VSNRSITFPRQVPEAMSIQPFKVPQSPPCTGSKPKAIKHPRLALTVQVEGDTTMEYSIIEKPAFRVVSHATGDDWALENAGNCADHTPANWAMRAFTSSGQSVFELCPAPFIHARGRPVPFAHARL